MSGPVPLVHVLRGGRIESVHHGSYVLVQDGLVIEDAGNPDRRAYFRSTAKPFQSMACVLSGAADASDLWNLRCELRETLLPHLAGRADELPVVRLSDPAARSAELVS